MNPARPILLELFRRLRGPVAALAVTMTALSMWGITKLEFDDNFANIFRQSGDIVSSNDVLAGEDNVCLVIVEGDDLLSGAGLEILRDLHSDVEGVEGVHHVRSLQSVRSRRRVGRYILPLFPSGSASPERLQAARERARQHPLVAGHLLSSDQNATLLLAQLTAEADSVAEIAPIVERIRSVTTRRLDGTKWKVFLTGPPVLRMELIEALLADQWKFNLICPLVALVIAWLIFRRVAAVIIVFSSSLAGVLWSVGTMGLVGEPINILNSLIPTLILTIGLTSSIHLFSAIRHNITAGSDRIPSILSALSRVGGGCLVAAVTTIIGFGSLASADSMIIARFGLTCAGSVGLTFLASIILVPLLSSTFLGNHIGNPRPCRLNAQSKDRTSRAWLPGLRIHGERAGDALIDVVVRFRHGLTITGLGITAMLLWMGFSVATDISTSEAIPSPSEARTALNRSEELFGGAFQVYATVRWRDERPLDALELLEVLDEVHAILGQETLLGPPISVRDVVASLPGESRATQLAQVRHVPPGELRQFLRPEKRIAIVTAWAPDAGSRNTEPMFQRVERRLNDLHAKYPDYAFRLAGSSVDISRLGSRMIRDLVRSLYFAVPLTAVVIAVALRSWKLALVSLPVNIFPLAATAAIMRLLDIPVQIATATVFSICFGLAVDDTIHFLTYWHRHRIAGTCSAAAINTTFRRVGSVLISTTVIITLGFAVVLTSSVPGVRLFGALFLCGLVMALVADLILLPAMLATFFCPAHALKPVGPVRTTYTSATVSPVVCHDTSNA